MRPVARVSAQLAQRGSSRESSVLAGSHETIDILDVQNQELADPDRAAEVLRLDAFRRNHMLEPQSDQNRLRKSARWKTGQTGGDIRSAEGDRRPYLSPQRITYTVHAVQGPEGPKVEGSRVRISKPVNGLLSVLGLQLRRLPKSPDLPQGLERATRGHLVEMIGPTGVGKSHFHDQLLPETGKQWLSRREIKLLMEGQRPFIELDGVSSVLVDDLLAQKQRSIWALDIKVWRKVALLEVFTREMALDIHARARVVPVAGLFSDEGITHNFTTELLRWYEERDRNDPFWKEALRSFMQGRSIILLDADDDTILRNLKRRHSELQGKQQNDLLAYWTEEKTLKKIRHSRCAARNWLELAASLGVNTLKVDLRQGLGAGKEKVLSFLHDTQRPEHCPDASPRQIPVTQKPRARAL